MPKRCTSRHMVLALGVSLLLHVGIAGVASRATVEIDSTPGSLFRGEIAGALSQGSRAPLMELLLEEPQTQPRESKTPVVTAPEPEKPQAVEEELVTLGVVDGADIASRNMIGFAEPTEHEAPKSEVNQPQLDPDAGVSATMPSGLQGRQGDPGANTQPTATTPAPEFQRGEAVDRDSAPSEATSEREESSSRSTESPADGPKPAQDASALKESGETRAISLEANAAADSVREGSNESADQAEGTEPQPAMPSSRIPLADSPIQEAPVEPATSAQAPKAPTSASSDTPGNESTENTGAGGEGGDDGSGENAEKLMHKHSPALPAVDQTPIPGECSEKQSDASSTEEPTKIKPGRPIAAKGLEIVTRRPTFSKVTRVIAQPADPTVELTFGRDGRVIRAKILKSSGYADVDQPVLDALYAWRARGEALAKLSLTDPNAGVTLKFTVMLN